MTDDWHGPLPKLPPRWPDDWHEPDVELLDELTQTGALAVPLLPLTLTLVERHRWAVRAALRCLLANRIITVTPRGDWPDWIRLDPPDDEPLTAVEQWMLDQVPGVVLLSIVATREQLAVPQSLIDDPPLFASFLRGKT